jgi:hypothetical protein
MKSILIVMALSLVLLPFAVVSSHHEDAAIEDLNRTVDAHLSNRISKLLHSPIESNIVQQP